MRQVTDEHHLTGTQAPAYQHGLASTYTYRRCRCAECRRANVEKVAAYLAKRAGREPPTHDLNAYKNWGCRCDVCRAANAAAGRQRNSRLRELQQALNELEQALRAAQARADEKPTVCDHDGHLFYVPELDEVQCSRCGDMAPTVEKHLR